MSDQEMLNYLIKKCGFDAVHKEIRCARSRIGEFQMSEQYPLPNTVTDRMRSMYKCQKKLDEYFNPAPKDEEIKNYDDEDLEDLKAGTSRHGSNRGHSSFGRNNNGYSID